MNKKNAEITYPRHWWISTNYITAYVQTDENDIVTPQSSSIISEFFGEEFKDLYRHLKRKHRGFLYQEYSKEHKPIYR